MTMMKKGPRRVLVAFVATVVLRSLATTVHGFSTKLPRRHGIFSRRRNSCLMSTRNNDMMKQAQQDALVQALVCPKQESLLDMYLVGRGGTNVTCLVLSPDKPNRNKKSSLLDGVAVPKSSLWVPLSTTMSNRQLKLLSFAYANKPISKSVCLGLNSILINRDGGLFDGLPWSTWSVDPQLRNRDAAGNSIEEKFHLGKRDAYNRFMGKDWQGRCVDIGNLALRLKYAMQNTNEDDGDDQKELLDAWQEDSTETLAKRILELKIRDMQMELAECEYQLARARTNEIAALEEMELAKQTVQERLNEARETLDAMSQRTQEKKYDNDPFYIQMLDWVANRTTDFGKNAPPYRGAMGYAPILDTKDEVEDSLLPYSSPYELLNEIIGDQLNADVIGAVLENTSLLRGTLSLGGALVLQRRTATKTTTIMGEELTVSDQDQDYGNEGGTGGATFVVECDADEAVGMALTCEIPIRVESQIWDRSSLLASPVLSNNDGTSKDVREVIPLWEMRDKDVSFLVEGQNSSNTESMSQLSIPRTTASLYDSLFEARDSESSSSSSTMFPTDNPIQTLVEFDALENADKAKVLLSMSNFDGTRLPRPRVVREAEERNKPNPLDDMLLPLVDESVRNQFMIRDAERRGDKEVVKALMESKSARAIAKEKAEQARLVGEEDVADWWDKEANLYSDLRADVTQDEGSYSRFLDKDEWYERDRQARIKKLKKSSFGTLLDGLE